jgi:transposase-like protein
MRFCEYYFVRSRSALRKVIKNRDSLPNDESMLKLLYLSLNNIAKKWTMPIRDWKAALSLIKDKDLTTFPIP